MKKKYLIFSGVLCIVFLLGFIWMYQLGKQKGEQTVTNEMNRIRQSEIIENERLLIEQEERWKKIVVEKTKEIRDLEKGEKIKTKELAKLQRVLEVRKKKIFATLQECEESRLKLQLDCISLNEKHEKRYSLALNRIQKQDELLLGIGTQYESCEKRIVLKEKFLQTVEIEHRLQIKKIKRKAFKKMLVAVGVGVGLGVLGKRVL